MRMKQDLMVFFSRDNLSKKIKHGAYVINLDEYADNGTYWIILFCKKKEKIFILIALVLSIFLKKLKNLLEIET